ncbi:copper chaperone PCu(A)C [Thermomonospora amylolytica]|uniref:copper chaperone PCu(A)C n=1 Tax=Thermomonospora amylolytica TaxID=1411117 RepID=UPI000E6BD05F|nr:copper chaperone PCu(A)C [Thermomonospora amylolytica]
MNVNRPFPAACAAILLVPALLTGCGSGSSPAGGAPAPATSTPRPALSITDPWVKAAGSGMTAAFGTLVNHTDRPITVVSAATPAARRIELHEVVATGGASKMRPKQGGFVVPARGAHRLTPGGDHIMLMDVTAPVEPGAEIAFTLRLSDGTTFAFTAVAKEFSGARESYDPGMRHG